MPQLANKKRLNLLTENFQKKHSTKNEHHSSFR
jgi:hypothetical protein